MKQYLDLMQKVLDEGDVKKNRTGIDTKSIFGAQLRFDLRKGFPIVTTKRIHWKSVVHELLWFISGDTSTQYLNDNGVSIWDEWALFGELGPIYGKQWREWPGSTGNIDQLQMAIDTIMLNPDSRRIIVSAWNPDQLPNEQVAPQTNVAYGNMSLAPCHMMFQFYATNDGHLDIHMYQRSVDVFLGLPFNISSYALLLTMVALTTYRTPRYLVWSGGDTHLYTNHLEQAELQLSREPKPLPDLLYVPNPAPIKRSIDAFTFEDFKLLGYDPHSHIKGDIAV